MRAALADDAGIVNASTLLSVDGTSPTASGAREISMC